jgi:hypothetical protein
MGTERLLYGHERTEPRSPSVISQPPSMPAAILQDPPPNHDCENMDMPAVVTPSVNVTDMACVGHVVYTIAFPQLCRLTPTFAWLYIHMSVTRWDVTPRNACLWPQALLQGPTTNMSKGLIFIWDPVG